MIKTLIRNNAYYDSVTLMLISRELKKLPGVQEVLVGMASDLNLSLAKNLGLMDSKLEASNPNDFFIAARFDETQTSMEAIEAAFTREVEGNKTESGDDYQTTSLKSALKNFPEANLVQISIPGQYAPQEVEDALDAGLHVMLFSDNVSVEDELRLKQKAVDKGLLLMGPDCGTAIINGVPLCFANAVRRGPIGVVGASGTGTQEVTCQIHKLGGGLSQVIGTGGRDLKEQIGGLMMIQGFNALINDPQTEVILLISKPPAPSVAEKIYAMVKTCPKPVVIDFIGGNAEAIRKAGAIPCLSFEDAALKAVACTQGKTAPDFDGLKLDESTLEKLLSSKLAGLSAHQDKLLALYTGGTLADEAMKYLGEFLPIYSNIPLKPEFALENLHGQQAHLCFDLGEDQFTRGRAHPMIDPLTRTEFFASHVNEQTALVLADCVLGYGSYSDPAGALAQAIEDARSRLGPQNGKFIAIVSITGTDQDPQDLIASTHALEAVGAIVMPSNAQAVRLAARFMHALEGKR